jgi:hypothetical protein
VSAKKSADASITSIANLSDLYEQQTQSKNTKDKTPAKMHPPNQ